MMAGWLFFRETNPDFLGHFLRLSPATSMEGEAADRPPLLRPGRDLVAAALRPRPVGPRARARGPGRVVDRIAHDGPAPQPRVQAAGVGVLASLTLVLRSTTSLDFIYFAF